MAERKYVVRYRLRNTDAVLVWTELSDRFTLSEAQEKMDGLWDSGHECSAVSVGCEWDGST